ncbi:MAG: ABC transporter substrate-binding protein [Tunicatimonas sp.]
MTRRYRLRPFLVHSLAAGALLLSYCSAPHPTSTPPAAANQPIDTVRIHHARGFSLRYAAAYPLLQRYGTTDTTRYWLLPHGQTRPDTLPPTDKVIHVPVQRLVVTSTTHLGLVELLDARDHLVGIGQAKYVYDTAIRRRAARGELQEVSVGGSLNLESVLALQPDLVMVSASPGAAVSQYQPLVDAGIPVVVNAEWQEASPLGKAEWVKLLAVLLGKESVANQRFAQITTTYDSLKQRVPTTAATPRVITGSPFQGAWYVPGRNSYVGQLLRDARATWPGENDTSAVSYNVALETLYPYGLRADYWINPGMYRQRSELREKDERLAAFLPYRRGEVYAHTRRVSDSGGNDYYESGAVRPDLVLADLIEILHPEVLDHSLYYYRKLE